jgi:hypothetical protein
MAGWPDTSATHGSVAFVRGADTLTLGEGGAVKAETLHGLRAYGGFEYSDVPLSDSLGDDPSRPTQLPLVVVLKLMVRGDVLLSDGSPSSDQVAGLQLNLHWLREFCAPFTTTDGTYATTLDVPGLDGTFTGYSHLELTLPDSTIQAGTFTTNLPLRVTVPAGSLTFTETP